MKDSRTVAQRNRAIRQDALREQLAEQCRLQHILENINKLEDLTIDLENDQVGRIKAANDQRIKLLGKYLPDLKATEVTAEISGDMVTKTVIEFVNATPHTDA